MNLLKTGARGPLVELLQTALLRAGCRPGKADGVFGARTREAVVAFQRANGLAPDGVVGPLTHQALLPWYTGYALHRVRSGDTLWRIARSHGASLRAVLAANPALDAENLQVGADVVVPLDFPVVPEGISFGSTALRYSLRGLAARYPFLTLTEYGKSVAGSPLYALRFGRGETQLLYNAAHHANEWITAPLLLRFAETLCAACVAGDGVYGYGAQALYEAVTLTLAPMVNPDGVDLVVGELTEGPFYETAKRIAEKWPSIPFPEGWKANAQGVDLNLQYPAGWEKAREIKFAQGYTAPAPRDYVGEKPLSAPESRALWELTKALAPALTLSYHTQGETIYWQFEDYAPEGAEAIGKRFARASGYALATTPYESGFAGYKDWFLQEYRRPGYTVEAGKGENPLPAGQLGQIFRDNLGILTLGMVLA